MAKKDRIGSDPLKESLGWIKDTRGGPEEGNTVRTSEDVKVRKSEGTKVGKSESEKKGKKSFSITQNILDELKVLAWYMEKSDSEVVEEALKQYLQSNETVLTRARKLRREIK